MILQAFREAGQALDDGELVCVFPEGQLTRTGMMAPFQRGLERIVKGRTTPIIPVHLDRLMGSIFSPASHRRLPERIPYPVTVSFGKPMPPDSSLLRAPAGDLASWARRPGRTARTIAGRCTTSSSAGRVDIPLRLAFADSRTPRVSYFKALAGALAIARALRPRWEGQSVVGILLPSSVGGSLVNLAATLAGKTVVNLNFTAGRAGMESAAAQAGLRTVVTSRAFLEKAKLEPPSGLEMIFVEDILAAIARPSRVAAAAMAICRADPMAGTSGRGLTGRDRRRHRDHHLQQRQHGRAQGRRPLPLQHRFQRPGHPRGLPRPAVGSADRRSCRCSTRSATRSPGSRRTRAWPASVTPARSMPPAIGELVQRYSATILLATPTFLQLYLRRCAPAQFGSIRLVLAGAEKLSESLALAFEDAFGIRPMEGYGMTECSPVVAVNTFDYREPGFFQPGSRRGLRGPVHCRASRSASSDRTHSNRSGADAEGLVLVKGPNVMRGYLGRDDLTETAFHDGWYVTGDLGFLSEDGFLKISGRLSRFSKIGGEMVPHGLIEEALQQAIGADVQVFAVTAVGDERKGEKLAVLHTLDDGAGRACSRTAWALKGCPTCSSPAARTSSRSIRSRSWGRASSI